MGINIDLNVGNFRHPTSTSAIPISETKNMSDWKLSFWYLQHPSPTPAAPTTPAYTRSLPSSPQLLPSTTACTPDHSSPPPTPSSVSSLSSPPEPPSPPQAAVEAISATASPAPSPQSSSPTPVSTGPPTPPPWSEAYVFSTDPDRIVCRKCCNRHYNYRWYSHCFMCNQT